MKVIFTMIAALFFFLSPLTGLTENGIQNRKDTVKSKVAASGIVQKDSISNYSININGKSNSVSINKEHFTQKDLSSHGNQKKASNIVEINGEGNSVTINQNNKCGSVNIQQNGTGNRVNISQSKPDK